ncbi:hypothetical protein [Leptospira interrogans]|uniref:hypothetical protein n=1 Tax=Leptospira interrogans TaxID=173 RepID=UPI000A46141C|nr:hypothetical protein [Leptospira interrogans]
MRKSFLKIGTPTILEFVRKIVICGSSHILGIEITTFFRKMNHGFPYVELTFAKMAYNCTFGFSQSTI